MIDPAPFIGIPIGLVGGALMWRVTHRPTCQRSCDRLHRVARMEREVYGQVLSSDVAEHVEKCGKPQRPIPPSKRALAPVREAFSVGEDDVRRFRQLVRECEVLKEQILERERRDRMRADLGVEGYGTDPLLPELRAVLQAKVDEVGALARQWTPEQTRVC